MSNLLRGQRGILIILAVVGVIVVALVIRGLVIGDTDNDEDEGFAGIAAAQVA